MTRTRMALAALSLSAAGLIGITQWEGYSPTAYITVLVAGGQFGNRWVITATGCSHLMREYFGE